MIRKPRYLVLAVGAAAAVFLAAYLATSLLLSTSCGAKQQVFDTSVRLVITAANEGCAYSLRVGQSFAVVSAGVDPWGSYPPELAGDGTAVQTGETVSGGGPGWGIYYKAIHAGSLTLPQHNITIRIRP